jgi:DNA polymerase V
LAGINPIALCNEIISTVKQNTGIPVSIGIGSTKTLAKVASYHGKKMGLNFYDLRNKADRDFILENLDVGDIWGIGKRIAIRLNQIGIFKANQLKDADCKMIRKSFGVIGEKIVYELNGISCLELEIMAKAKKSIVVSRSFGRPVTAIEELEEALATYVAKACVKMRRQNAKVQGIEVFLVTNRYVENNLFYKNSHSFYFDLATDNTMKIVTYAKHCLKQIFKPNCKYKKVGILLLNLVDNSYTQTSLLSNSVEEVRSAKLMKTLDSINNKMGRESIFFASQGIKREWQMKAARRSANFTGDWNQLISVE